MTTKELDYMKAWMIEWLRRGIQTFDERTLTFITEQTRIKRGEFSAMLEEFIDILEDDWEEKR